jgi:hypothetical protein
MSPQRREPEPLNQSEVEILHSARPTAAELAIQDARHALDHAVMAIFELAFSLESLGDAIGRFNAETSRQLLRGQPWVEIDR